jgi:hypothetical protein
MSIFLGWDFNRSLERAIDRNNQVKQNEINNQFRAADLGEKIATREALERYRIKELNERIRANQAREDLTASGQDVTMRGQDISADVAKRGQDVTIRGQDINVKEKEKDRNLSREKIQVGVDEKEKDREFTNQQRIETQEDRKELINIGKTKEERASKKLNKAKLSTIPNFSEYNQNEAVQNVGQFGDDKLLFDEGEFSRAARDYVDSIDKNLPTIITELGNDPTNPQLLQHIADLEGIQDVFENSGEYTGPLDETVFDFFEGVFRFGPGEATRARQVNNKIKRMLGTLESVIE